MSEGLLTGWVGFTMLSEGLLTGWVGFTVLSEGLLTGWVEFTVLSEGLQTERVEGSVRRHSPNKEMAHAFAAHNVSRSSSVRKAVLTPLACAWRT